MPKSSVLTAGAIAIIGAVVANLIVLFVLRPFVINPEVPLNALHVLPVALFSFIGAVGAIGVYAIIKKFSRKPVRLFVWISIVFFLISLVPDFLLFNPESPSAAAVTVPAVATLMLMHAVAGLIIVGALVRFWPPRATP